MKITVHKGSGAHASPLGKTAVCLCGGGITGALFEVGVLAGFDDALGRGEANTFDIYLGSSAGATVASLLSQGVTAERAFAALRDPSDGFFPIRREDVYRLELRSWMRSLGRLTASALGILWKSLAGRGREQLAEEMAGLHRLLPAGLFRLDHYRDFLRAFFAREGLSNRFAGVARELYVVANDVDSAERVVFGSGELRQVEIAVAVAASSALPIFFEPVRVGDRDYFDGGIGRVDHVDVAIAHGADRILVVNPIVPIRANRLRDGGLFNIGNQAFRIASKARLHFGIKRYLAQHPGVEVVLIEPGDDETVLFVNGSMGLGARAEILDWAREATRSALRRVYQEGVSIRKFELAS